MRFERKIVAIALVALIPMIVVALALALTGDFSWRVRWTVIFFALASTFIATWVLHEQLVYPLRTISNLITALREEDYSLRGRRAQREDALGEVLIEVNELAHLMESRKLEAVEAGALLRGVLEQIDVAIFTFDGENRLRLVNRAGQRLLALSREQMIGSSADALGLGDLPPHDATIDREFKGGTGRWDVRHTAFREGGAPHRMLVISDITRALREEEVEAWRRIVRVLGHELNNSLAPIKSIAASLEKMVTNDTLPEDWREDLARGMRVIGTRTEALSRFTRAYAQLARLPEPRKRPVAVHELVRRIATLESRVPISLHGDEVRIHADEDQLEQLLINLVKNAADASAEHGGAVRISWQHSDTTFTLEVEDEGRGVSGTANLFIPFFTTKPQGSGIGLFLSRQIAEAHGGTLTLENREGGRGAVARLVLSL